MACIMVQRTAHYNAIHIYYLSGIILEESQIQIPSALIEYI
jgi:hypothetical protein